MSDGTSGSRGLPTRRLIPILVLAAVAILLLMFLAGCGGTQSPPGSVKQVSSTIYCGRNIPAGGQVTDAQFADFIDKVVTPAFPAGLTVFDAYGQMRTTAGQIVKQTTKVIVLVHDGSSKRMAAVQNVIDSYRQQFGKPQVMCTTQNIDAQFFGD